MVARALQPSFRQKEERMNEDTLKGKWEQLKGKVRTKWAKLTDDDVERVGGAKDQLVGKIRERYGHTKEDAEREVDDWLNNP
jgi:uncharacterized protein YjbJ (UPF0337 family)